ncbi:hypothetical protein BGW39_011647 [Mortierella sp. 14UC]|nr:hypothetical protein BGW39_011647 [Mortierella sp. 14UC]
MSSFNQPVNIGPQEYSQFRGQIDALVARFAALSLSDPANTTTTAAAPSTTQDGNNTSNEYLPQLVANDLWALFTQDTLSPSTSAAGVLNLSTETGGEEGEEEDAAIDQWAPLCP